ncbi:MAG: serine protease [Dehalococcoidia bacterium]
MPTWGQILKELNASQAPSGRGPDFDGVRRKYLKALSEKTGRAVILYATAWLESRSIPPPDLQIGLSDIQGLMEAVSNIEERELDLIIHSPGGSAEAAEAAVEYIRKRFEHVRVFVPIAAMSAATMIALSADELVMGQHSQLGPIDPQFIISMPEGSRSAPAKAILNQFELAKEQCRDPANLAAWIPILRSYAPGLLTQCEDSRQLAMTMVSTWLARYMLAGEARAEQRAKEIAEWFANYEAFRSHGRRVGPEQVSAVGVKVTPLENDDELQDAVLSVHHATMHTFSRTAAAKIVENHHGRAWVKLSERVDLIMEEARRKESTERPMGRAERRRQQRGKR